MLYGTGLYARLPAPCFVPSGNSHGSGAKKVLASTATATIFNTDSDTERHDDFGGRGKAPVSATAVARRRLNAHIYFVSGLSASSGRFTDMW